jgi:hypothetical protein
MNINKYIEFINENDNKLSLNDVFEIRKRLEYLVDMILPILEEINKLYSENRRYKRAIAVIDRLNKEWLKTFGCRIHELSLSPEQKENPVRDPVVGRSYIYRPDVKAVYGRYIIASGCRALVLRINKFGFRRGNIKHDNYDSQDYTKNDYFIQLFVNKHMYIYFYTKKEYLKSKKEYLKSV